MGRKHALTNKFVKAVLEEFSSGESGLVNGKLPRPPAPETNLAIQRSNRNLRYKFDCRWLYELKCSLSSNRAMRNNDSRIGAVEVDNMKTIEIRCRAVSGVQKSTEEPHDPILLNVLEEKITLRELIERTVREQIRLAEVADAARRDAANLQLATLRRQYLTREEIEKRAAEGRISLKQPAKNALGEIHSDDEIKRALKAFETGVFIVMVNGRQSHDLDEVMTFEEQTRVTFVRLTPLVGG
jgi:hypothetical protein